MSIKIKRPSIMGDNIEATGCEIKKGDIILKITGGIKDILKIERTILNLLQRMSGIATHFRTSMRISRIMGDQSTT